MIAFVIGLVSMSFAWSLCQQEFQPLHAELVLTQLSVSTLLVASGSFLPLPLLSVYVAHNSTGCISKIRVFGNQSSKPHKFCQCLAFRGIIYIYIYMSDLLFNVCWTGLSTSVSNKLNSSTASSLPTLMSLSFSQRDHLSHKMFGVLSLSVNTDRFIK